MTTTTTTTTTLHEAIAAARAGDMGRAQQLAAENVRANPDDANAWYLLSQLVESDARRAAYLSKTLALDPAHARARIEFDALPPALVAELAPTVELPAAEPAVVEAGPYTTDELMAVAVATATADAATADATTTEPGLEAAPEELPEWLQPLSPEPVGVATVGVATTGAEAPVAPEAVVAPPAVTPRPQPAAPRPRPAPTPKRNGGNQALTILLGLLAVLTVVVLGFLIYLLFA